MTIKENSIGLGAMVTFIGLYLGIIFLISCAAILALKELSESSDNVEKFNMLRKIGVDEKMINKALFRQIGVFFMFPLLVAIIHSVFGIKFCNFLLLFSGWQLYNPEKSLYNKSGHLTSRAPQGACSILQRRGAMV